MHPQNNFPIVQFLVSLTSDIQLFVINRTNPPLHKLLCYHTKCTKQKRITIHNKSVFPQLTKIISSLNLMPKFHFKYWMSCLLDLTNSQSRRHFRVNVFKSKLLTDCLASLSLPSFLSPAQPTAAPCFQLLRSTPWESFLNSLSCLTYDSSAVPAHTGLETHPKSDLFSPFTVIPGSSHYCLPLIWITAIINNDFSIIFFAYVFVLFS